jgi:23S rRNA (adenine2503-C2)-methyltransferase
MDLAKVSEFLVQNNQPSFRFKQIQKNYFSGRYASFDDMTDLSKDLRAKLSRDFSLYSVKLDKLLKDDFTQKARLTLEDGQKIETVLMNYDDWLTVCVSSQVGCPLGCKFCATGQMGLIRNLTAEEIIDQILFWKNINVGASLAEARKKKGFRIVFMGMGEPFLNWKNLLSSLKTINSPDGLGIGARKISISTAGIIPKIREFADLNTEINLAVSLHSADQQSRESLMPIAKTYPLSDLQKVLVYYVSKTHRQVFFEYILIKDTNDTPRHLKLLIDFIKSNNLYYLNLIPLNPIKGGLVPSPQTAFNNFVAGLKKTRVNFSVRHSQGSSINSACGQLITQN